VPDALPSTVRDEARCVRALLAPGAVGAHFQPIVRLDDSAVIGYEALARPRLAPLQSPERFLAAARRSRLRAEAELACWRAAALAGPPPGDRLLFLNVSPTALARPGFLAMAEELAPRLVLELTERDSLEDTAALLEVLEPWAERGALLALDDLGSGFASLESVLDLRPQFIKVGRRLVSHIDADRRRRRLLAMVADYTRDSHVTLIAEGVERDAEVAILRALGVDCAQGYLFARPGPAWPEATCPPARSARLTRRLDLADRAPAPREAGSVADACRAVVERFARDLLMPSVYLERGGLLRCQAIHGYWQLLDGIPPWAGVVGTTFATGRTRVVDDVETDPDYIRGAPAVRSAACVPVRSDHRVIGVLGVESPVPLPRGLVDEMETAGLELGRRLDQLGTPSDGWPADRLARHAAGLAALVDSAAIGERVVQAACDVAGMDSAAVATAAPDGTLGVLSATGPLGPTLAALSPAALAQIAGWVEGVRSAYTYGDSEGHGLVGHAPLRAAGVESLAVLPLVGPGGRIGVLVLAHPEPTPLTTRDVELLELLAALASSCLATAASMTALTHQAASDPLTGLGHGATFRSALLDARRRTQPAGRVGLILVDVDGFKSINDSRGHLAGDSVLRSVAAALSAVLRSSDDLFRVGGDEFAAIVEVTSGAEALGVARRLVDAVGDLQEVTVSAGVAVASGMESDSALFARADAALYAVKRRSRNDAELAGPPAFGPDAPRQGALWA
jgi:diguanylate cyclase (GGDEF)-like protein